MLKERQKSILRAVIERHIETARPVASRDILREFAMPLSPATVRNEMLALDDLGYLEQPHTSAGRTPTDKGYRFFADNLGSFLNLSDSETKLIQRAFTLSSADEFVKGFSRTVSEISGMFSAAGLWDDNTFYEHGFTEILSEPEFQIGESLQSFARLADTLDEDIRKILENLDEEIFIGAENPLEYGKNFTMFALSWRHPRGFEGFLTMAGPKRTNYARHKAIVHKIKEISHE